MNEKLDLNRFIEAQRRGFQQALSEIRNAHKESHWIWYVFPVPVIKGISTSANHHFYALTTVENVREYMREPYLGSNMRTICEALIALQTNDAVAVMGSIDAPKLHSCITVFAYAIPEERVFRQVLGKFFAGKPEPRTLAYLGISEREFFTSE